MATFSDGGDIFAGTMRSGSPSSSHSATGDMRFYLQTLLDNKEKQLQQAGTLGQQLLAQRMELEERIRQLQDLDLDTWEDESADAGIRDKYRDLAETIKSWDVENEQLSGVFTAKSVNGSHATPPSRSLELSRNDLERSLERSKAAASGTTAAQSSRRAKNAAHRADDVEFAFEIGSGLLTEVRRLQSLLGERDKAIQDMKEEKDDMEKTIESLRTALQTQEQSADKYKEENWNLEVTLQELRTQLSDSQASTQRLEGEQKRLTRMLTSARENADQHKNDAERHQNAFEELKAKHETDVAQARKHAASLQRDKSDLQQTLDSMKAEMSKATRRLPRFGSPLTPNGPSASQLATPNEMDEEDVFSIAASTNKRRGDTSAMFPVDDPDFADMSPDPSPSKPFLAPNHPTNEIEALQQRLAHAQRQINTLKGTIQREKELRIEYKRKLDASPGLAGGEDDEEEFVDEEVENVRPKTRATPYRSGGRSRRGRGRGGLSLIQRLNLANQSPSSEYDYDGPRDTSPPPPVPPITFEADIEDQDQDEDDESELQNSPCPAIDPKRTSVEGMDPMFANILRRSASASSLPMNASPLRQSVLPRQSRGNTLPRRSRGGAAYQEARPPSLIGQPEALAAELGFRMGPSMGETIEVPEVETAEFGCQTEYEEPPAAPLVVIEIPPSPPTPAPLVVSEIGIQVDPEPLPVITKADASLQTEAEPKVPHFTVGIQHEYSEPKAILVSAGVATEPEPIPLPKSIPVEVPKLTFAQAEVQTPCALMFDVDVQTIPEPQPIPAQRVDIDVQTMEVETPAIHVSGDDDVTVSYGTIIGDNSITPRPAPLLIYEEDDGTQTETGSFMETDFEDYQDARQSIVLTTPTESLEDYHSILTVTDNDFSDTDDDEESIKAARLARRAGGSAMSSTLSVPLPPSPAPPPLPAPTYESKGISTDPVEEPVPVPEPKVEPILLPPEPPKPEVKEMCIQTDEWSPTPPPVSAPSTPAPAPSPTLFRIGPPSQQFQFISAPPSATPTTASLPNVAAPSPNIRDAIPTFIPRPRSTQSDRKLSMESTFTSAMEDLVARARTPSNVPSVVDKTRPPMMVLPPPPRQPPPPNAMLPPSFIPDRRFPTTSMTSSRDIPPPRPSSPPPPELIQRATTPTFGAVLSVPGGRPFGLRQHGSSMPPSQAGLRQLPSTSSFRSAANAATRAQQSSPSFHLRDKECREMSSTSLNSNVHSLESQRSSISSENQLFEHSNRLPAAPETPDRTLQGAPRANESSTDPTVIHAITQTMIGEFLYKYTRRTIGKGHGERRHKRFFWVHPYTRTLYWSSADPGSSGVTESSAKSAYIESVRAVLDPNPMPPGIHQYSVVVSTPQREMKFTAPTKERHEIWLNALQFLLSRPGPGVVASPGNGLGLPNSPMSADAKLPERDPRPPVGLFASPQSQRSARTTRTGFSSDTWNITPRGQKSQSQISLGGSMGKRSGTPAAEYLRWNGPDAPNSPTKSFERIPGQDDADYDFELHEDTMSDEGFEGLENVRACCDGRHTVGRSGKIEHHHHHDHDNHTQPDPPRRSHQLLDPSPSDIARPSSPAWSFRSHAGSATSHDREGGFFARFGSRRSTKTTPVVSAMAVHDR